MHKNRGLAGTAALVLVGILGFGLAGCAPRYLAKTPGAVIAYPYIPVTPQEINNYKALIAISPRDPNAVKARYWIAQDMFNSSQWDKAEKAFVKIFKHFPHSEWAFPAGLMAARTRVKREKNLGALTLLDHLINIPDRGAEMLEAVQTLAGKIINDELNLAELATVRATYPKTDWDQQALFVTGKRNLDGGNPNAAIQAFTSFIDLYPANKFVSLARELVEKAARIVPVNRNRIGCLLPLSGAYAPYGKTLKQGMELALEEINRHRPEGEYLGLAAIDSKGTTNGAVTGLQRLIDLEKVMVVIGPALSSSVKALLPVLERRRIPVISPAASESGLAAKSAYLFRYMLTNQEQGEAMAEYVVLRRNYRRIGILHSTARYDCSLAEAFAAKVQELGGEVAARLEYPQGATDFKQQMLGLGGVDPGRLKDLEVRERKKLERLLENIAYRSAQRIAPRRKDGTVSQAEKVTPTPVPRKRVAILRFAEQGNQTQEEALGKWITEKFSYALAVKPGLKVLTQKETFKALKELGLSSFSRNPQAWKRLGESLGVEVLVLGQVSQIEDNPSAEPGVPIPVQYQIDIRLVRARNGRELEQFSKNWSKSIAPEVNVKDIEAIYLPVPAQDAVLIGSQLAFYDLKVPVFGSDAWLNSKLLRQGAEVLEGAVFAAGFWPDHPAPRSRDFVEHFEARFSTHPSLLAVQAYDVFYLVAAILKQIRDPKASREDFQRRLLKVRAYKGVTGKAVVEPDGEIRRPPVFLELHKGKLRQVR